VTNLTVGMCNSESIEKNKPVRCSYIGHALTGFTPQSYLTYCPDICMEGLIKDNEG
jgi:hypothetical protein